MILHKSVQPQTYQVSCPTGAVAAARARRRSRSTPPTAPSGTWSGRLYRGTSLSRLAYGFKLLKVQQHILKILWKRRYNSVVHDSVRLWLDVLHFSHSIENYLIIKIKDICLVPSSRRIIYVSFQTNCEKTLSKAFNTNSAII